MQDLINRLTEKAGISAEQATKAIDTIKDFVKEKFPMMAGAVDNLLSGDSTTNSTGAFPQAPIDPTVPAEAGQTSGSIMDKISDVIPGETGQKVEDFAKKAAEKAEDVFDDVKEKLSGMFGGDKK